MDILTYKHCTRCGVRKSLVDFPKDKRRRDGRASWCSSCHEVFSVKWQKENPERNKANRKANYAANSERERNRTRSWRRNQSPESKENSLFLARLWKALNPGKVKAQKKKWDSDNKEYKLELNATWRKRNPDKVAVKAKSDWQKRRARKLAAPGGGVSKKEWQAVLEKYGYQCIAPGPHGGDLAMDHVKPLSRGGADHVSNVQPLCRKCNARKGTKEIDYR